MSNSSVSSESLDWAQMEEKIMKGSFLNTSSEEYGYYVYNWEDDIEWNSNYNARTSLAFLHLITAGSLTLLGVPTDLTDFTLETTLYVFDSTGSLISTFNAMDEHTQVAGLYYGKNPTKNLQEMYENTAIEVLELANIKSSEINQKLQDAGPSSASNKDEAIKKMEAFVSAREAERTQKSSSSSYSYSSTTSSTTTTTEKTLENGVYYSSGGPLTLTLGSYGLATLGATDYNLMISGVGSYTISNGRITIKFGAITGAGGYIQSNQTYTYTINDSSSFSGGGVTWTK